MKHQLKSVLNSLGLLEPLTKLKRCVGNHHVAAAAMRFPTYNANTQRDLALIGDYFRYATIALAVRRILADNIPGSFAEAGVYRGDMSRFIHQLAPDRPYHLFDTFAGFPSRDLDSCAAHDARFRDTSVEAVLKNIGDTKNIIIRQGCIPETFAGLENERFAFVLLDMDLYPPTAQSLKFFYPRLPPGGYLIVHDYNSPESNNACQRAVDEFLADKPEKIIELADEWGSVLLRKS
jgi:O-methyltransferase